MGSVKHVNFREPTAKVEHSRNITVGFLTIRIVPASCPELGQYVQLKKGNNYAVSIVLRQDFNISGDNEFASSLLILQEGRTMKNAVRVAIQRARKKMYSYSLCANDIIGQLNYLNFRIRRAKVGVILHQRNYDETKSEKDRFYIHKIGNKVKELEKSKSRLILKLV